MRFVFLLACALISTGCLSLSRHEKETLREFRDVGIRQNEMQVKHPAAAGALNILPGFGNFYLAAGSDESDQWVFGFLNLLSWPFSILWGVPEAAIDATNMNKRETVYYYTKDDKGRAEFEAARMKEDGYSYGTASAKK